MTPLRVGVIGLGVGKSHRTRSYSGPGGGKSIDGVGTSAYGAFK